MLEADLHHGILSLTLSIGPMMISPNLWPRSFVMLLSLEEPHSRRMLGMPWVNDASHDFSFWITEGTG
jgi:hypothetical protein